MSNIDRLDRALAQITQATSRLDAAMCSGLTIDVTDLCQTLAAWDTEARELGATEQQIDDAQLAGIS
ncbi:hypothetical protein E5720_17490 [Rhodococcus sp. PAMC28707]|uniref:hypothetical protein n=1 Tax=unclassified Rhodococcus (in: high G+C Gram-positive bacteria) TaxID=192944 RepID=UPI00109DFA40|nr:MULTISPECIES: hypothetical protein [unclassified Rhodococcus (in: high G+C Gram-positive bacteria)]QCB51819.1 hypothetical protein E5769_18030 [Rhodococcus sp. PAMC28705]QCB60012.1 hypothetical protein E5720_17490 [Rhodococcus sp. PAMC28707]